MANNNSPEIVGIIIKLGENAAFGANGFRKRDVVVKTDEQYPQEILVTFTQDRCDILNSYQEGEPVRISYNLQGRSWVNPQGETVWFNTVAGWRISKMQPQQQWNGNSYSGQGSAVDAYNQRHNPQGGYQQPPQGYQQPQNNYQHQPQSYSDQNPQPKEEEHDDLPF